MTKKLRMAVVVGLLMGGGFGASASAVSDGSNCGQNGENASGCDFDGDGVINKDDADDDADGIADDAEADGCGRDADPACGATDPGEGGGGDPAPELPVDPEALIAEVVAAVEGAAAGLPVPPGDVPPMPGDVPPVPGDVPPPGEPPADPATVVATVEAVVADATGQLPPVPSDPPAVPELPAPPALPVP